MTPPQRPDKLAVSLASEFIMRSEAFMAPIDYSAISTIVGFSAFTTKTLLYFPLGRLVYVVFDFVGTSNNIATTFTLPYTSLAGYTMRFYGPIRFADSGVTGTASGRAAIPENSNVCTLNTNWGGALWTASGTKEVQGELWYFRA